MTSGILISLGADGHICHDGAVDPPPTFGHSVGCLTGEHPRGWMHPGGPHAMCGVCRGPEVADGADLGTC